MYYDNVLLVRKNSLGGSEIGFQVGFVVNRIVLIKSEIDLDVSRRRWFGFLFCVISFFVVVDDGIIKRL